MQRGKNAKITVSKIIKLTQTSKLRVAKIKGFTVVCSFVLCALPCFFYFLVFYFTTFTPKCFALPHYSNIVVQNAHLPFPITDDPVQGSGVIRIDPHISWLDVVEGD